MLKPLGALLTLLAPRPALAAAAPVPVSAAPAQDLTGHAVGYIALGITVLAYVAAMSEDLSDLRKSFPMMLGAALVWFVICLYYTLQSYPGTAVAAFEGNLLAYAELLLFILVSMSYLNAMEERGLFAGLRIWLLNRQYSYRQLFWIMGSLAFLLSAVVSGLAVGMLIGAVAMAVGQQCRRFVTLACVHIVSATNAGGSFNPLSGISTLFVWQHHILHFVDFLTLFLPCLANFLVPALIMHGFVPRAVPTVSPEPIRLRHGGRRIVGLFGLTLAMTVLANVFLALPPAEGMMAGLALLQIFSFYLIKTAGVPGARQPAGGDAPLHSDDRHCDIFQRIGNLEWDTLLFFYGAPMIIGALGFVGYLDAIARALFGGMDTSLANILIGLSSAFIDNGTLMFAVLNMHPAMSIGQWLLLTLTLGVGGSRWPSVPRPASGCWVRSRVSIPSAIICAGCR